MKFKKSESGRSMVEMLGVLAIIGVLSVGGIAGYSLSMRRHRANQVVDLLSKYALLSYSQQQYLLENGRYIEGSFVCDFENCGVTHFRDSGLGTYPAGVYDIGAPRFEKDAETGEDIVIVSANFDDDKLCKAVASVVGTACVNNNNVALRIKQN